jgi:hypothetical protein
MIAEYLFHAGLTTWISDIRNQINKCQIRATKSIHLLRVYADPTAPLGECQVCTFRVQQLWGPPSLVYNGCRGLSTRVKRQGHEADHSPPTSAKVKNCGDIPALPRTSSWRGAQLSPLIASLFHPPLLDEILYLIAYFLWFILQPCSYL